MRIRAPRLVRRLIALFTWSARDRDMDREMEFHVESMIRDYVRSGMSRGGGRTRGAQAFRQHVRLKEQGHDVRRARFSKT